MKPIRFRKTRKNIYQNPKTFAPKEKEICKSFYHQVKIRQQFNLIRNDILIFHIANESPSSHAYRIQLAQMGVLPGVFDYIVLVKGGGIAFLEFKRTPKDRLSPKQAKFTETLDLFGIKWKVVWNSEQAFEFIVGL